MIYIYHPCPGVPFAKISAPACTGLGKRTRFPSCLNRPEEHKMTPPCLHRPRGSKTKFSLPQPAKGKQSKILLASTGQGKTEQNLLARIQ